MKEREVFCLFINGHRLYQNEQIIRNKFVNIMLNIRIIRGRSINVGCLTPKVSIHLGGGGWGGIDVAFILQEVKFGVPASFRWKLLLHRPRRTLNSSVTFGGMTTSRHG